MEIGRDSVRFNGIVVKLDHFEEIFGCRNIMGKDIWLGWSSYKNVLTDVKF